MTLAMVVPSNIKSEAENVGASRMIREHHAKQKLSTLSESTIYSSDGENPANDDDEDEVDNKRELITKPGEHDVLLGRGGGTNNHSGNVNFRTLVNQHKMRYLSCSKVEKPRVAREVVKIWRKQVPPGRFLQKKEWGTSSSKSDGGNSRDESLTATWVEVSEKKAQEKASQCLRERTADVLPYLSQLQQHRDQMREHGVNMISQHFAAGGPTGAESSMPLQGGGNLVRNQFLPARHLMENSVPNQMMMSPPGMMNNNVRRGSMPAGCSPATSGTLKGIPKSMSPAARRTSMPAMGNHLPGHHQRMPMQRPGMDVQQQLNMENQVLQEAYTAIEQSGGVDPRSMMLMEQMMQEQEMMERAMMRERHAAMMHEQEQQHFIQSSGMSAGMPPRMASGMSPRINMGGPFVHGMTGMSGMNDMNGMSVMGNMTGTGSMMGGDMAHGYPTAIVQQQQEMMMQARMYHESMKETLIDQHRAEVLQRQAQEMFFKQQSAMRRQRINPMAATPNNVGSDEHFSQDDDTEQLLRPKAVNQQNPPPVINLTNMDTIPLTSDHGSDDEPIPLSMIPDVAKSSPISGQRDGRKRGKASSMRDSLENNRAFKPSTLVSSLQRTDPHASGSNNDPVPSPSTPERKGAYKNDNHLDAFSPIQIHDKNHIENQDDVSKGFGDDEVTTPLKGPTSLPSSNLKLKSAIKGSFPPRGSAGSTSIGVAAAAAGAAATSETTRLEYLRALELYMSNCQIPANSKGAVDIDDDISDDEGDAGGVVGGVDPSAWLQLALHDSGETSLNHTKKKRTKKDHRDHHPRDHNHRHQGHMNGHSDKVSQHKPASSTHGSKNDDLMSTDGKSTDGRSMDGNKSMDGMSLMSLAVSELEQMERNHAHEGTADDSDMEEESVDFGSKTNKMGAARSMASNLSVMSELTDFSDNDDDHDDDVEDL